jgi:hypothetical protein
MDFNKKCFLRHFNKPVFDSIVKKPLLYRLHVVTFNV